MESRYEQLEAERFEVQQRRTLEDQGLQAEFNAKVDQIRYQRLQEEAAFNERYQQIFQNVKAEELQKMQDLKEDHGRELESLLTRHRSELTFREEAESSRLESEEKQRQDHVSRMSAVGQEQEDAAKAEFNARYNQLKRARDAEDQRIKNKFLHAADHRILERQQCGLDSTELRSYSPSASKNDSHHSQPPRQAQRPPSWPALGLHVPTGPRGSPREHSRNNWQSLADSHKRVPKVKKSRKSAQRDMEPHPQMYDSYRPAQSLQNRLYSQHAPRNQVRDVAKSGAETPPKPMMPQTAFPIFALKYQRDNGEMYEWKTSNLQGAEMRIDGQIVKGYFKHGLAAPPEWQISPNDSRIFYYPQQALIKVLKLKDTKGPKIMWLSFPNTGVLEKFLFSYERSWQFAAKQELTDTNDIPFDMIRAKDEFVS